MVYFNNSLLDLFGKMDSITRLGNSLGQTSEGFQQLGFADLMANAQKVFGPMAMGLQQSGILDAMTKAEKVFRPIAMGLQQSGILDAMSRVEKAFRPLTLGLQQSGIFDTMSRVEKAFGPMALGLQQSGVWDAMIRAENVFGSAALSFQQSNVIAAIVKVQKNNERLIEGLQWQDPLTTSTINKPIKGELNQTSENSIKADNIGYLDYDEHIQRIQDWLDSILSVIKAIDISILSKAILIYLLFHLWLPNIYYYYMFPDESLERIDNLAELTHRIDQKIENGFERIHYEMEKRFGHLDPDEARSIFYTVDRSVKMRFRPTTRRQNVLLVLIPGEMVRLIDKRGKWIKVEYFDLLNNKTVLGWCYKKYLKRVRN